MRASRFVSLTVAGLLTLQALASHGASTVEFANTNYTGVEGTPIALQLVIDPPVTTSNASVTLVQTGGSAANRSDYIFDRPTVTIPPSQTNITAWIYMVDDGLPENDETVEFTLTSPD